MYASSGTEPPRRPGILVRAPSSDCVAKRCVKWSQSAAQVFEVEEWDRSPCPVTPRLTYRDLVELKQLELDKMPQSPFRSLADLPLPIGLPKVRVPLQPIFDGRKHRPPTPNSTPIHTPDRVSSPAPPNTGEPSTKQAAPSPTGPGPMQLPDPALSLASALLAPSPPTSPSTNKVMRGFVFMPLLPCSTPCNTPRASTSKPPLSDPDASELCAPSDSETCVSSEGTDVQSDISDPDCLKEMDDLDITDSPNHEAPPHPKSIPVDEPPDKLPPSPSFEIPGQRNPLPPLSPLTLTASPISIPRNRSPVTAVTTPLAFPSRGSGGCSPVMGGSHMMTACCTVRHGRQVA